MEEKRFETLYPENTRFDEIESILRYVQEGNFCQIVGIPGVGKGTLLACLAYNRNIRTKHLGEKQSTYHFVRVNCKELRQRPFIDVVKLLFLTLVESVRDRKLNEEHQKLHSMLKESLALNDELVLLQGFKKSVEYLALEKGLTLVFLLEQFQAYVPSSEFFLLLSDLKSRAQYRFSVIFSLNRPLEQMIEPSMYEDVYPLIAGHAVLLKLSDEPSLTFELEHLQKQLGKTLAPEMQDELFRFTGGHGKLIRVCAEEVLNNYVSPSSPPAGEAGSPSPLKGEGIVPSPPAGEGQVTDSRMGGEGESNLWQFFLDNRAVRNVSYEIWNSLSPQEQQFLKKLSVDSSLLQIQNDPVKQYLENVGLLKNNEFTILLFKEFVLYRAKHLSDEKITYRSETNDILKGDTVLTNKLTSSEFRLLQYLLQHSDQVIERDQIVNIVWKDAQSTAGVTDQAIDQLVFRLRRKIEDDPNDPKHLKTIKGRGLRFTL